MRVTRHTNPAEFFQAALPMLLCEEAANCFFLGHVPTLTDPTDVLLCIVWDESRPVAAAIMTPGRHLLTTAAPAGAMEALVDFLIAENITTPGIQTRTSDAKTFASLWCARTGASQQPQTGMGIYRLTRVIPPRTVAGQLRQASANDVPLVAEWMEQFGLAIGEPFTAALKNAHQRIDEGRIFLWENTEAVSMAAWAGPTPNGVRINLVFTPPAFRQRGYASSCVAALSQRMLDAGKKFCFLYTDLGNPTSNKIYRDIGYQHVRDDMRIFFKPAT